MRRALSFLLVIAMVLSMGTVAFASENNQNLEDANSINMEGTLLSTKEAEIISGNQDIILDNTEIMKVLSKINDPSKKALIEEYCYNPLYLEVNTYSTKGEYLNRINEIKLQSEGKIEKIKDLAISDNAEISEEIESNIEIALNEVASSNNKYISSELYNYVESEMPELSAEVRNKVFDENIVLGAEIDIDALGGNERGVARAISSKYYNKSIEIFGGLGVFLVGTCEVDWTYDTSTNKIQSLYPNTTFVYDGVGGSSYAFEEWGINNQYLSADKSKGYVRKQRFIISIGPASSARSLSMVWDLVFSPNAGNSNKTLYEYVSRDSPAPRANWGGGY